MASVPETVRLGWHISRFVCVTAAQQVALARITAQTVRALTPWMLLAAVEARRVEAAPEPRAKPTRNTKVSIAPETARAANPGAARRGAKRSPSMPAPLPELRADLLA